MSIIKSISNSEWQPTMQKASAAGVFISTLGLIGIILAKRLGSSFPKVVLPITASAGLFSIGGVLVSRPINPCIGEGKSVVEICQKLEATSIPEEEKITLVKNLISSRASISTYTDDDNGDCNANVYVNLSYANSNQQEPLNSIVFQAVNNLLDANIENIKLEFNDFIFLYSHDQNYREITEKVRKENYVPPSVEKQPEPETNPFPTNFSNNEIENLISEKIEGKSVLEISQKLKATSIPEEEKIALITNLLKLKLNIAENTFTTKQS